MTVKDLVLTATRQLFVDKDPSAVDRWVAPGYIQHNTMVSDGPEGLRSLVAGLPARGRYDRHRAIADGDLVAVHGTYHGFDTGPMVAFDVFRVADGKLAEHWDALTPWMSTTVSGHPQTGGPTTVTSPGATEVNRALVTGLVSNVLISLQVDRIAEYISTETFLQHDPDIADGLDGFVAVLSQGLTVYDRVHKVIAEGNFVLAMSEGRIGSTPTAFYDLFRAEDGRVVEHWDVTAPIPAELPHTNGVF
jgi:predicted SnoaL-like aldol condensation-catalyzing enzyme